MQRPTPKRVESHSPKVSKALDDKLILNCSKALFFCSFRQRCDQDKPDKAVRNAQPNSSNCLSYISVGLLVVTLIVSFAQYNELRQLRSELSVDTEFASSEALSEIASKSSSPRVWIVGARVSDAELKSFL
jgi:hypothetical protein